jgi:hypothetical protein
MVAVTEVTRRLLGSRRDARTAEDEHLWARAIDRLVDHAADEFMSRSEQLDRTIEHLQDANGEADG